MGGPLQRGPRASGAAVAVHLAAPEGSRGVAALLRRFAAYLEKRFGLLARVQGLADQRRHAQVPTAAVWLATFAMFALRFRSFNGLEEELRRCRWLEAWVGARKPSADTLGRALSTLQLDDLRDMLLELCRSAWRSKAIHGRAGRSTRVLAVDGHELWASTARCCQACLVRELKQGERTVLQYYHRVVVAQWVGVTPPAVVDVELVLPHEGEVVAARRLLKRVLTKLSRLVDVVCGDALYLESPFCQDVLAAHKHFVVVMKQEARTLYQEAAGLRRLLTPRLVVEGRKITHFWEITHLDSFTHLGRPVRVVWAEEETQRTRKVGGRRITTSDDSTWIWVTDLDQDEATAEQIAHWGHDRWDLENRGFNELATTWGMDHCFFHHPNAIQAILLTLFIAFLTTYLFYERNLQLPMRRHLSRLTFGFRLREDLVLLGGQTVWPPGEPSG